MAHYRVYLLDAIGRIAKGLDIDCASDSEAKTEAQDMLAGTSMAELWRGVRQVAFISARPEPVPHVPTPIGLTTNP